MKTCHFHPRMSIDVHPQLLNTTTNRVLFHCDNCTQIHLNGVHPIHPNVPNKNHYQTIGHYVQWSPSGPLHKYHWHGFIIIYLFIYLFSHCYPPMEWVARFFDQVLECNYSGVGLQSLCNFISHAKCLQKTERFCN
jgi:hypothetical protein